MTARKTTRSTRSSRKPCRGCADKVARLRLELLEDRCLLSLDLLGTVLSGGPGNQRGTAISIDQGAIYLSGDVQPESQQPSDTALVLKYPLAPNGSPIWSRTFNNGTNFFGISAANGAVYAGGDSYSLTSDPVGGKEVKPLLARFRQDGSSGSAAGGAEWVAGSGGTASRANFFAYSGVEMFSAVAGVTIGAQQLVYAAGFGQPASYSAYLVAKYDTAGNRQAAATDSSVGVQLNSYYLPIGGGGSSAAGLTVLNNSVYLAGSSGWAFEGDSPNGRPAIWKYDANLNLLWRRKDTSLAGTFRGVAAANNAIYAVGYRYTPGASNSEDYLIEKYDEAGNRLWTTTTGGANTDVLNGAVVIGNKLFAVGYTRSQGAGGADAVVLEIDPGTGAILSQTLFGGPQDDMGSGAATDGTDLYVVGESKSFAQGGNALGENDLLLLRYAPSTANLPPLAKAGGPYSAPEGTPITFTASGSSDPNGDALQYRWDFDNNGVWDTAWSSSPTASYTFHDNFVGTAKVEAYDGRAYDDDTAAVTVGNVAPQLANVSVTPALFENGTATLSGEIVDPASADTFTLTVDWGDGSPIEIFAYAAGKSSFTESHRYRDDNPSGTSSDNYTIRLELSDKDQPAGGAWTTVAPISAGFYADGGAVLGDQQWYVVETASSTMKLEAYNAVSNTWTAKAAPPTVRAAAGVAGVGDRLYVVAGWLNSDSNRSTNLLQIYNATTNQWTTGAPASRARGSMAVTAIGSKIYVTGGRAGNGSPDDGTLEIYDTVTNTWSAGAPLPTPRENVEAAAIGGRMYVVGGFIRNPSNWNTGEFTGKLEIYNPGTNQWTTGTSMPTPRWDPAVAVVDGKLYVAGGLLSNSTVTSLVEVYDPASNRWSTAPSMPTARWYPQGATIDGKFYVASGTTGSQNLRVVEAYALPGPQAAANVVVTVNNAAPTITDFAVPAMGQEGTPISMSATATDPAGASDPLSFTWTVTRPDGSSLVLSGPSAGFTPADDGSYGVSLAVADDDGGVGTQTRTVSVANLTPVVDAGADQAAAEGAAVSFSGSFNDAGSADLHTILWDFGDGSTAAGTLTPSHVYADNGSYSVTLTVTDDDGAAASDALVVTVANAAPVVNAGADQAVAEGAAVVFSGSFNDAGSADTHTIAWDFGDGTTAAGTLNPSHVYADNGSYTVTLTVTDDDGSATSDALVVTVANVAPVVDAGADQAAAEGATVSFNGLFTDAGSADTHTITWDFGDGKTASGTLTPSHVYADNGSYTVTLTVTDDDGSATSDALLVTVANVAPVVDAGADQTAAE
ncbi:MAG: PKD domain-containing protein, partial [Pirellulales bacterium]|nr:PKD domain-containing protein [Pirellulales bacterium]